MSALVPTPRAHRSQRVRRVAARSVSMARFSKHALALEAALYPEQPGVDYQRPATRADCVGGPRPCPFVSCRYHLYLDASPDTGAIKYNFPDLDIAELPNSCALDVADEGGTTLEGVAQLLNMTRERVRQIEREALHTRQFRALAEHYEPESVSPNVRRLPLYEECDPLDALEELQ